MLYKWQAFCKEIATLFERYFYSYEVFELGLYITWDFLMKGKLLDI